MCCSVMVVCGGSASPHRGTVFACAFPCRPRSYTMFPDKAASTFSRAFYHALIAPKQTVKNAFDIAVNAVNMKASDASEMFLLLPLSECGSMKRLRSVFHARDTTFLFLRRQYAGNIYSLSVLIVMLTHFAGERWLKLASEALCYEAFRIRWKRSVSYQKQVDDRHSVEPGVNSCGGQYALVTICIVLLFTSGESRCQDIRRPPSG